MARNLLTEDVQPSVSQPRGRNLLSEDAVPSVSETPAIKTTLTGQEQRPTASPTATSIGGSLFKAFESIPASTAKQLNGIVQALKSPIQSAKIVGLAALGAIQEAPGLLNPALGIVSLALGDKQPKSPQAKKVIDAVVDNYKDRYGSIENARIVFETDPVGMALDASLFLSGAGLTLKGIGFVRVGSAVEKAAQLINPITVATKTVGGAIKTVGAPINVPVQQASKRLGVTLPASSLSKSSVVPTLEAVAAKGLGGQQAIERIDNAFIKLTQVADDAVLKADKISNLSEAGKVIGKSFNDFRDRWHLLKGKLYEQAALPKSGQKIVQKNVTKQSSIVDKVGNKLNITTKEPTIERVISLSVNPQEASKFAGVMVAKQSGASNILGKTGKVRFWERMQKKLSGPVEASDLKSALQEVNRTIKFGGDPVAVGFNAELKKLAVLMSDDLDKAIISSNPKLAGKISRANTVYRMGLERLNNKLGKQMLKAAESEQFDTIPKIVNQALKVSIDDIPKIQQIVGPKNWSIVQASTMRELFSKSMNPTTGTFRPKRLSVEIAKFGEDKLGRILSKEQLRAVKDISIVSASLDKPLSVLSGSQTGFINRVLVPVFAFGISPIKALKILLGDALFTKFVSSQAGQKVLTEGLDVAFKTGSAVGKVGAPLGTAGAVLKQTNVPIRQNQ